MSDRDTKRDAYAELAKLKFDAEEAIARAMEFAETHDIPCNFENITVDRGGLGRSYDWYNSSRNC